MTHPTLGPLRWCPRCSARLRTQEVEPCPNCGLPAAVFTAVDALRREYLAAIAELTAAHGAAIAALVRDYGPEDPRS